MKRIKIILVVVLFVMVSCAQKGATNSDIPLMEKDGASWNSTYDAAVSETINEDDLSKSDVAKDIQEQELKPQRKLIKNAVLSFETDSMELRKQLIDRAVEQFGGYIANEEHYASYDRENVAVTVRVPGAHFDEFVKMATQGVGTYESRAVSVNDVTEEYIDVAARIETKKELKKRFVKLLDRAESIKKIFEIEREISALQEEIESFESRLIKLSSMVAFSTVTITYYKLLPEEIVVQENAFVKAFGQGWDAVVLFLIVLTNLWPFIIILLVTFIIYKRRIKQKRLSKVK